MNGNALLVAESSPETGYAWWWMEELWAALGHLCAAQGRRCFLAYPTEGACPARIAAAPIEVITLDLSERADGIRRQLAEVRKLDVRHAYLSGRPYLLCDLAVAGVRTSSRDHNPGDRPAVSDSAVSRSPVAESARRVAIAT